MKKTLILLCSLFLGLGTFAQDNADPVYYVVDGINYQIDSSAKTATVTNKRGKKYVYYTDISANVPSTINYENETYTVVLGEEAFSGAKALETVTLPSTITVIPVRCFSGVKSLRSISLPTGLTEIQGAAFSGCTALASISLPQGLQEIQGAAFSGCTALTSISLPQGLKKIGTASDYFDNTGGESGVFQYTAIVSITIPSSVTMLGDRTFSGCKNLEQVTMSAGIKDIGIECFYGCSSLKQLTLPSTVETIGFGAFDGSSISSLSLPESVNLIGRRAFARCLLAEIKLPASLKVVRPYLLQGTPISTLEVPVGVERVNPHGLSGITTMKTLIIADGGTTLDFDLKSNSIYGRDPWKDGTESDAEGKWFNVTQKYIETLYIGRNTAVWIPEGYVPAATSRAGEGIDSPFAGFQALKDITIGSSVTIAPDLVFADYPELKTLTILTETPLQLPPMTAEQAESVIVTVPESCVETYRNLEGWSGVKHINGQSAIDIIAADEQNAPVEYFNLRGEKISNPSNGIFIKRQGSEITKVKL